ncbi:MAG: LamG domain-containing protein [Thermofilaceae archaeon]
MSAGSASRVSRAGGLWFNGRTAYAEVPHSPSINLTDAVSVTAWINMTNPSSDPWGYIVCKYTYNIYSLIVGGSSSTGIVRFHIGGSHVDSTFPLTCGRWYFLAATYDRVEQRIYIDGKLNARTSNSIPIPTTANPLYVGDRYDHTRRFHGIIDDVRIYNRALSDDEIRTIYELGALIRNGLVLHLDFTEYEGSIAYDKSGCGNHATIYGARWVVKKPLRVLQG